MINENPYKLNSKDHDEILCEIRKVDYPKIVIIGGQTGAGKSKIITLSENKLLKDDNVVIIKEKLKSYIQKAIKC